MNKKWEIYQTNEEKVEKLQEKFAQKAVKEYFVAMEKLGIQKEKAIDYLKEQK